jgi:hypothetical protein
VVREAVGGKGEAVEITPSAANDLPGSAPARYTQGFPLGGRSSNGRTHGSEPWYRGSNPCLPASLRSPFGRATARSACYARRHAENEPSFRRRLSRRSGKAAKADRSFCVPESVRARSIRVLSESDRVVQRNPAQFELARKLAPPSTCEASERDLSTSSEATAILHGTMLVAPRTSTKDSGGTTRGRAAIRSNTDRGRSSCRLSFQTNELPRTLRST